MLTTDQEFFTAPQVAELLGVERFQVIKFINSGELRAVDVSVARRIRPRWRISRKDLEAFLARRSTSPEPKPTRRKKQSDDDVIEFYSP